MQIRTSALIGVLFLQSCIIADWKAEDEIEKLHNKLDAIDSLTYDAIDLILENNNDNEVMTEVMYILDDIKDECYYDDYTFSYEYD